MSLLLASNRVCVPLLSDLRAHKAADTTQMTFYRGPERATDTDTAVDTKGMISSPSRRTATHTLKTESNGIAAFNAAHWYLWPCNAEKHDPWLLNHSSPVYTKSDASLAHTPTHKVINGYIDAVACVGHQDVGVQCPKAMLERFHFYLSS